MKIWDFLYNVSTKIVVAAVIFASKYRKKKWQTLYFGVAVMRSWIVRLKQNVCGQNTPKTPNDFVEIENKQQS